MYGDLEDVESLLLPVESDLSFYIGTAAQFLKQMNIIVGRKDKLIELIKGNVEMFKNSKEWNKIKDKFDEILKSFAEMTIKCVEQRRAGSPE